MIEDVFNEIKEEARRSCIKIIDDGEIPVRVGFNIVEDNIRDDIPNFYIRNKDEFYKLLNEYIICSFKFYNLDITKNNVKTLLTFLFSNITVGEMNSLEDYVKKYINFINDDTLTNKYGIKDTSIGLLNYNVLKQSFRQETPYYFNSYFKEGASLYYLPRISFGISNGVCFIYAIQNKDSKYNIDPKYNLKVKNAFNTINSSINKYRNVTPSFIITLTLFLSFLKENNISKIKVESPLPIRMMNRELVTNYKIKLRTMQAQIKLEDLNIFIKELQDKKLTNDYNSTVKFINCFNRLKIHFDSIFLSKCDIDDGIILSVIDLQTKNALLKQIVESKNIYNIDKERYNGKIS